MTTSSPSPGRPRTSASAASSAPITTCTWAATAAPGPTDAWMTLAGLARDTSTIRLGTLVTSATFRLPGPLAIQVAGVDQMSGGRVELGLGAGWFEAEHTAYGIPFPPLGERFDRLEEQLAVITGLWATHAGRDLQPQRRPLPVVDSPALPKPVQQAGVRRSSSAAAAKRTPRTRGAVCRRVQCCVRPSRPTRAALPTGSRGGERGRTRPVDADALGGSGRLPRQRRGDARAPRRCHRARPRRAA